GGTAAAVELSPRQHQICEAVGTKLKANGVLFAGLDLIGEYLTEINITSPTGIRPAQKLYGTNPAEAFWQALA
ncbi:MAG: glutathione synthase, partial [Rickettsiales bacterium]|nr:glutathione synthase [Rickettsiales bacterium]